MNIRIVGHGVLGLQLERLLEQPDGAAIGALLVVDSSPWCRRRRVSQACPPGGFGQRHGGIGAAAVLRASRWPGSWRPWHRSVAVPGPSGRPSGRPPILPAFIEFAQQYIEFRDLGTDFDSILIECDSLVDLSFGRHTCPSLMVASELFWSSAIDFLNAARRLRRSFLS